MKSWKGKRGPRPGDEPKASKSAGGAKARDKGTTIRSTAPTPPPKMVARKLTVEDLAAHGARAARLNRDANVFEEKLREASKKGKAELKKKRAEVNVLLDQVATGVEMVKQGDLFEDGSTKASRINEADAKAALADVGHHGGEEAAERAASGAGAEAHA